MAFTGTGNSAILTPDGKLKRMFAWSFSGSFVYSFSNVFIMNLSWGWINLDTYEYKDDNSYQAGGSGHLNYCTIIKEENNEKQ
jgi:hypothetical protein